MLPAPELHIHACVCDCSTLCTYRCIVLQSFRKYATFAELPYWCTFRRQAPNRMSDTTTEDTTTGDDEEQPQQRWQLEALQNLEVQEHQHDNGPGPIPPSLVPQIPQAPLPLGLQLQDGGSGSSPGACSSTMPPVMLPQAPPSAQQAPLARPLAAAAKLPASAPSNGCAVPGSLLASSSGGGNSPSQPHEHDRSCELAHGPGSPSRIDRHGMPPLVLTPQTPQLPPSRPRQFSPPHPQPPRSEALMVPPPARLMNMLPRPHAGARAESLNLITRPVLPPSHRPIMMPVRASGIKMPPTRLPAVPVTEMVPLLQARTSAITGRPSSAYSSCSSVLSKLPAVQGHEDGAAVSGKQIDCRACASRPAAPCRHSKPPRAIFAARSPPASIATSIAGGQSPFSCNKQTTCCIKRRAAA